MKAKQKDRVLAWLKTYGYITVRLAVTELGVMSLPRRIADLREDGYNIVMNYKKTENGSKYGVYTLAE